MVGHAYSADLLLDLSLPAAGAFGLGLLVWLLSCGRRGNAVLVLLALGGTAAIELTAKELVRRPSINLADTDYSFPSGHAAVAAALVGIVLVLAPSHRRLLLAGIVSVPAVVGCVLVVARGWHYPSDVVGGILAAGAWVGLLAHRPALGRGDRDRDRDASR